ncbi:MAG: hypothetical protein KJP25_08510 [Gammaproteobacteria bacterium]|nr:hypothetical protein [Gammaproteobacteria bacterium]
MSLIHERIKDYFPTVLITLLSIVQALALELLWGHIDESEYLFVWGWPAVVYWIQVLSTLIGIVLIWLIYAMNAMRFRWLPSIMDSIFPFIVGIIQFILVADLGPDGEGAWLFLMGVVFILMTWSAQETMRRARLDPENAEFFENLKPATLRDFAPQIVFSSLMAALGIYVAFGSADGVVSTIGILLTFAVVVWQFVNMCRFWMDTIDPESTQ